MGSSTFGHRPPVSSPLCPLFTQTLTADTSPTSVSRALRLHIKMRVLLPQEAKKGLSR